MSSHEPGTILQGARAARGVSHGAGPARNALAAAVLALLLTLAGAAPVLAQNGSRPEVEMDPSRAALLYVSNRPEDHSAGHDFVRDVREKARQDSIYAAVTRGVVRYDRVTYRSRVGDLDIPAYVFQPLETRGPRGHAALVWVHAGVHGTWTASYWPFVRAAVERGYVVIAPDYRGSTGYGQQHHDAIDYGGHEVDDVISAHDWLAANLPHVDPARVGIMGWSHGGYIALLAVMRGTHAFRAAAAIVPVSNLIFRLSYKGPFYQRLFATQSGIGGLPFERRALYVERSPVYQVDRLDVPLLVHVATNDDDVDFVESEMLIHALRVKQPSLAETHVYVDPPGGHSFSRQVDMARLEAIWTPEMRDSWSRTWTFLDWHLRPYEDRSRPGARR